MMQIPGQLSDMNGHVLKVHRAWPRDGGRLIFEAAEVGSGRIRAGSIDAAGFARITPYGEDPVLRGLTPAAADGELLVHRYKRRAVVRSDERYTKFVAPGKAAAVAAAHHAVATCLAGAGLTVPDVVATDSNSVTVSAVPGVSLHDLGQQVSAVPSVSLHDPGQQIGPAVMDQWTQAWQLWSLRWPRFATAPGPGGDFFPPHSARDEAQTVSRWVDQVLSVDALGVAPDRLRKARGRVLRMLAEDTAPGVLAHRDLHDKQLLFNAGTHAIGLIDCDTLAVAEPALDLANLSVHLDFRVAQGVLMEDAASIGKHYIADAAGSMGVPVGRLQAYAAATALRLACIYAFRPPYRQVAGRWFDRLELSLETGLDATCSTAEVTTP